MFVIVLRCPVPHRQRKEDKDSDRKKRAMSRMSILPTLVGADPAAPKGKAKKGKSILPGLGAIPGAPGHGASASMDIGERSSFNRTSSIGVAAGKAINRTQSLIGVAQRVTLHATKLTGWASSAKRRMRKMKSYEQNVSVIRSAVIVMFPPRRRKILAVLKEVLEEDEGHRMTKCAWPANSCYPFVYVWGPAVGPMLLYSDNQRLLYFFTRLDEYRMRF